MTISPLGEQYLGVFYSNGSTSATIAGNKSDRLELLDFGFITNDTEQGLLLLYRNGIPGNEAGIILP